MKEELEEMELGMQALETRLAELAAEAGRLQESVYLKRGETDMDHHRKHLYVRMGEIEAQIRELWRETVFLNTEGFQGERE